jgi:multiple sugar transport system ATP-binding protein
LARSSDVGEPSAVHLDGVSKIYSGSTAPALQRLDLQIEEGSFFSILGPSGCGKTTMLRIVAGFEYPSGGRVYIGGRDVTALSPRHRDIAMVFQDYALYPHMSAARNIGFNLRNQKISRNEVDRRVGDMAVKLGIEHLLPKKPAQLSGGERQRVALGRALIRRPQVFLMDEPLSNLDLKLREAMRLELGRLHQGLGITTIYVTHDQAEAMTLSTRLAVMRGGVLQQVGLPDEVYAQPANAFVARFIGSPSMNLIRMRRDGGLLRGIDDPESCLPMPCNVGLADQSEVLVGVRPHHLRIAGETQVQGIRGIVTLTEHLGRNNYVVCQPRAGTTYLHEQDAIQIETAAGVIYSAGNSLTLTASPESIRLFDLSGQAIQIPAPRDSHGPTLFESHCG